MKAMFSLILALVAFRGYAANGVEFAGFMQSRDELSFILCDQGSGQISPWIRLGQPWDGYRITRFDPSTDCITVLRGTVEKVLALRHSKPGKAPTEIKIVNGSYLIRDGARVYTADAQIRIGRKLVSSPNGGFIVSNEGQDIFEGDFSVETPNGTVEYRNAVMRITPDGTSVDAVEAFFGPSTNSPNQSASPAPRPDAAPRS